jgi:hypothetical protein
MRQGRGGLTGFQIQHKKGDSKQFRYYLDEVKIRRVRQILGAKTETEAIDAALNLVVFKREILKSLEKVAGKGGVQKIF